MKPGYRDTLDMVVFQRIPHMSEKTRQGWLNGLARSKSRDNPEKPACAIVDVDGTLCDVSSIRHHVMPTHPDFSGQKRFDRFHGESIDCPPHKHVVRFTQSCLNNDLWDVFIVTSRKERWKYHTLIWMAEHDVAYSDLYMRADFDNRPDVEVKADILAEIRKTHEPIIAIDDNPSIIELWESENILTITVPGWEDDE